MSTHPDPGDRVQKTLQRIAASTMPANPKVERDAYLQRIDGMVYGEDPRNGYFKDVVFYHPTLRFRVDFPAGWKTQNQASQVVGLSPQQDAIMVLSLAGNTSAAQGLSAFLGQQGVSGQRSATNSLNGLPAAVGSFTAQTQEGALAGYVAFVELDGRTYRLLAYTPSQLIQGYSSALQRAIGSFSRLTDPQALSVRPARVRIVRLPNAMTLTQFNGSNPSVVPIATLAAINGVDAAATLPAGTLVKRVVVE
jgi:predicted Zn-dependent protease